MRDFTCKGCDSHQLSYQSYVKSTTPVDIDEDGNISYQQPVIDYDDDIGVECGFVCHDCHEEVRHAGQWLTTESDLIWYLSANPDTLAEQEKEFEAHLEDMEEEMLEKQEHHDEVGI